MEGFNLVYIRDSMSRAKRPAYPSLYRFATKGLPTLTKSELDEAERVIIKISESALRSIRRAKEERKYK